MGCSTERLFSVARTLLSISLLAGAACSNKPPDDPADYMARIAAARAAKDEQFTREKDPIPQDRKAEFLPLAYFPIDPDYHVLAALKPAEERTPVMMPTSSGQLRRMFRLGTLEFTLKGQPMTLTAFTEGDVNRLFVPFSDLTSGTETYAAGRFLDLDRTGSGVYELDFNQAYIPYCYYNASFECPYPPQENRLKVPIRVGENEDDVIRAVVFDFDGVIANSEPLHFRAFRDVLADDGVVLSEEAYYSRYLGFDDVGAFQAIAHDQDVDVDENRLADWVARKARLLEEAEGRTSVLFPGARAAIERLATHGPLAIASGALRAEIERVLHREHLRVYFSVLVAAEDAPKSKPDPAPYAKAVAQLAALGESTLTPRECVAIEDSRWGLQSAKAAGLRTIAITTSYGADELPGADLVIDHLDALTRELLSTLP